jgi:NAD(P)-dependent dehydrogenase (short-subunit alcohol dehydrogenase family)
VQSSGRHGFARACFFGGHNFCGESHLEKSLAGKTALVTGGSRNIGHKTAVALAKRGADVIITFNTNATAAASVVRELEALEVRAHALQVNLTGTSLIAKLVGDVRATLQLWNRPGLDILINNAGIMRLATFDKVTEDDLDANYQTNFKSLFFLTQGLLPILHDGGSIVNLGSGTARIAFGPLTSYGPIKAAVQSLTLYLASFLGNRGIRVNAVAPGGLDDDFNAPLFAAMPPARDYIKSNTALRRLGSPTDVGDAIAMLCAPDSAFISGAVLNIDGGYHL